MNDTEVFEPMGEVAAVPPVWCERKIRFAESVDTVLDPSAISILVVLHCV